MLKHFWREKNANFYLNKATVITPSINELYKEIVVKFEEKLKMIDVIFDKYKREEYLLVKKKDISKEIPELIVKQKIGERVCVDFLQLIKDLCELKNLNLKFENKPKSLTQEEIYNSIQYAILNLNSFLEENLKVIHCCICSLMMLLFLDYNTIELQREIIEKKEGSFIKGKIVLI